MAGKAELAVIPGFAGEERRPQPFRRTAPERRMTVSARTGSRLMGGCQASGRDKVRHGRPREKHQCGAKHEQRSPPRQGAPPGPCASHRLAAGDGIATGPVRKGPGAANSAELPRAGALPTVALPNGDAFTGGNAPALSVRPEVARLPLGRPTAEPFLGGPFVFRAIKSVILKPEYHRFPPENA